MKIVVAAPLAALFAAAATVVLGAAIGWHPLWPTPEVNISEYAALIDTADVVRLIRGGTDPNRAYHVRPEFLADWQSAAVDRAFQRAGLPLFVPDGMYEPLRVAVIVRQPGLVRNLLAAGATLPGAARTGAICFAEFVHESSIVEALLPTGDRSDPRASCPVIVDP